jgi:hypothetical protein
MLAHLLADLDLAKLDGDPVVGQAGHEQIGIALSGKPAAHAHGSPEETGYHVPEWEIRLPLYSSWR